MTLTFFTALCSLMSTLPVDVRRHCSQFQYSENVCSFVSSYCGHHCAPLCVPCTDLVYLFAPVRHKESFVSLESWRYSMFVETVDLVTNETNLYGELICNWMLSTFSLKVCHTLSRQPYGSEACVFNEISGMKIWVPIECDNRLQSNDDIMI
jgi:hypothetical protein